ncbi:hypothetical protein ACVDG8_006950 [Mesorhizobium sp. ORM8.1]
MDDDALIRRAERSKVYGDKAAARRLTKKTKNVAGQQARSRADHDPEKWNPVFGYDHGP